MEGNVMDLLKLAQPINVPSAIKSFVVSVASFLKPILSSLGIVLPPAGYVIVAAFFVSALLYYLHKMTFEILKAVVIGVIVAIALHILGII